MITSRRIVLGLMAAGLALPALSAPRSRLIAGGWQKTGRSGGPDHGAWDQILRSTVVAGRDGVNRVRYGSVPLDRLNGYLQSMAATDPTTLTSAAAFSYWVNLYNALTVKVVAEAYPISSIRKIGGGLFSGGPWQTKLITINGTALSLDDIEHGILRPVWRDARVHYAVNCASIGCPNLAPRAYRADRLSDMLRTAAISYVTHPRGVTATDRGLVLSSIYDWFKEDFGGTDAGVLKHIEGFLPPKTSASFPNPKILRYAYDWSLNDA